MTEKRFVGGSYGFYDRYKKDRMLWSEWKEITEIMNNLDLKARERSKALSKLQKKNDNLIKISAMTQVRNDKLKEENEQLKQRVKQLEDNIVNKIKIISGDVE